MYLTVFTHAFMKYASVKKNMDVHIYVYIHIHTSIRTYIHTYMHTCIHILPDTRSLFAKLRKADAVGRAMTDPSARAKAMPEDGLRVP